MARAASHKEHDDDTLFNPQRMGLLAPAIKADAPMP
jgi:hypothetical protein